MEQGIPVSASVEPLVDYDTVCQRVRAAIEALRVHAVSLHDDKGDVLWMTESSMGPDEHNAVVEAYDSFSKPGGRPIFAYDLGDSRSAVVFRAVNARRALAGAIMLIVETRGIQQDEKGMTRFMTPQMQRVLVDFAAMRPMPASPAAAPTSKISSAAPRPPAAVPTPAPMPARTPTDKSHTGPMNTKAVAAPSPVLAKIKQPQSPPFPTARPASNPAAAAANPPTPAPPPAPTAPPALTAALDLPFELTLADSMSIPKPPMPPPAPHFASSASGAAPSPVASSPAIAPFAPRSAAPAAAAPPPAAPAQVAPAQVAPAPAAPLPVAPLSIKPLSLEPPALDLEPLTPFEPPGPIPDRRQTPRQVPDVDRLHAALRRSPIALNLQRLVPLTKGSQLRRYEVLLRSSSSDAPNSAPQAMLQAAIDHGLGSMVDRRVITHLVGWLVRHPEVWRTQAILLTVNLTSTALQDEHFIQFVGMCLAKSSLPQAMIGFEIDVPTAADLGDRVTTVAAALERLGCPLVLDNFGLRTECFDLLRLPGVRYVKLAPEITSKMRTDKISQAAITAVVQMARVLGMHTVAKRTENAAEQEWLTALGVDFVQSNALSPPVSIDTLLAAPASITRT